MTSIKDVAEKANVSIKTVSRILGGFEGVSAKTKEKVTNAMKELDYAPSAAAQALRGVEAGIVSLITDNLTTTPDSYEIVAGIQNICDQHGKQLLIGEMAGKPENFERLVDDFKRHRSQAIILATVFHKEVKIEQAFKNTPLILVNCFEQQTLHPTIIPDDYQGGYDAAVHLINKGHTRIAELRLFEDMKASQLRHQGYKQALSDHQIAYDPTLIRIGVIENESDEFAQLEQVLKDLLSLPNPPSALMCGNDKMAMRTYMLVRGVMGYQIPQQISIVGYDNYRLISENLLPKLSTVSLPYFAMGQEAAKLAIAKIKQAKIHKISGQFVDRGSVATLL
ncbi:LacI family DNA-binding transcriptional regulator [Psychrosphaera sp. B3R10]|uniref:LacI family DNA-binding transcriptional regulator n=1 Tax=Psychrosphaera algicola TaxID=3023714 RepID=A0ABT5F9Q6_9GAMM|nr:MULTISPECIES: LacI family DNA-binding transcriptional regulator [unclassified Psychrosphaera]MBU2880808.1 LacI family DNA-binding transcriptional regulator [Psychrosphaera sp. I2R16]MBU2990973.1 LacI family DNA-binding transcriptional regulator [Psychrosphaera sp. B3R10]MDC2887593.1 LacI family DNA-binding transcriptional regulator [Psychrosphaera sp. G1-22]MDO6720772.1 LacI family DNA-binding transcriptional regulator [Psychrosphaera sp. 1_MG-2023]